MNSFSIAFLAAAAGIGLGYWQGKASMPVAEVISPRTAPALALPSAALPGKPVNKPPVGAVSSQSDTLKHQDLATVLQIKQRSKRFNATLGLILDSSKIKLPVLFEKLIQAFEKGLFGIDELAFFMEALGTRSDAELGRQFLGASFIHDDPNKVQQFLTGWASADARSAKEFVSDKNQLRGKGMTPFAMVKGLVLGMPPDPVATVELIESNPKLKGSIDYWKTEADVRANGFDRAIKNATEKPSKDNETFVRLEALGTLAGQAGDGAFMNYVESTIGSSRDIGPAEAKVNLKFSQRDYNQSYEYALRIPSGDRRTNLLSSSIFYAGMKDPDAAIELVRTTPAGSMEEQKMLIYALEDAFRQSPKVSKEELPNLMSQTHNLVQQLKFKK